MQTFLNSFDNDKVVMTIIKNEVLRIDKNIACSKRNISR